MPGPPGAEEGSPGLRRGPEGDEGSLGWSHSPGAAAG